MDLQSQWDIRPAMSAILLRNMHHFVAVAHAGSFLRAAHGLGISSSTLSRHISELETAIGLRLLNRTTRSFSLTEAGGAYLAAAEEILMAAETAHETLQTQVTIPQGLLRISMPESLLSLTAHPWIVEFARTYPKIEIELNTSPTYIDPAGDNFDIAIRDDAPADSSLTMRRLATFRRGLFASPNYVDRYGLPSQPEDLVHHQCIRSGPARLRSTWRLRRGADEISVAVRGPVQVDSLILAPTLALDGLGIASAAPRTLIGEVSSGRLVPILADWEHEPMVFSALMASKMMAAKTRVFLDFIAIKMRELQNSIG